jgi:hypothetical protein
MGKALARRMALQNVLRSPMLALCRDEKTASFLTEESIEKRASSKKFEKVLKKIPDVESEEYDRI